MITYIFQAPVVQWIERWLAEPKVVGSIPARGIYNTMNISLSTTLEKIRKIDNKRKKALKKLGLKTIRDLIFYYPKRYDDFSTITSIQDLKINTQSTIRGQIKSIDNEITPRKRMRITKALVSDQTGSIKAIWFNQPYLTNYLKPGTNITLNGNIEAGYPSGIQISNPSYEKYKEDSIHSGRIVPIYSESAYLTSRWIRYILKPLLKKIKSIDEWLPDPLLKKYQLTGINTALNSIHFPDSIKTLAQARKRLAFDEMFLLQLNAAINKYGWQKNNNYKIKFNEKLIKEFVRDLPFELTKSQKISTWEILKDLAKDKPMNRLVQGDVGSGKTIVAAIALLQTIKGGFQTALMAPTEILAQQHYQTLNGYFKKHKIKVALVTGNNVISNINNVKTKKDIIDKVSQGQIDILIGTHALIQDKVKFNKLALAIIDEQHRFGVKQREKLKKIDSNKNKAPHLLSMTATPIPRTLTLSIFGDLDVSIIDEMPKGRKEVITKLVAPFNRDKAYQFILKQVNQKRQVFVVCPLIEESDKLGVKSATMEYQKLKKDIFPNLNIGILHGRLKKEEKEIIMQKFIDNKINILVSTAVIEVGVDIPNATIMMIEGADRFGLAQLHQFRGRVGRSRHQSYCFLFTESQSEKTFQRLNTLVETNNGFKLAEMDLQLRGAGEIYGVKQSGLPDLHMASLTDLKLIKITRDEAQTLIFHDPELKKCPVLKKKLERYISTIHFE